MSVGYNAMQHLLADRNALSRSTDGTSADTSSNQLEAVNNIFIEQSIWQ